MAEYLADVRKAKNYAEFKKMHPDVDITREGFLDLKRGGRGRRDYVHSPKKYMNRHDGGMAKKTRTF